ncbi:hypothetical protein Tco_0697761 [Tanacetum coccineum]
MSSSSTITYTSVYTDSEPGRVLWGADEDRAPRPPDYVPGPEHPPSPIEVPYVLEPEYPEYLVPFDAEAPLEDQPLPADASPTALSPGYVADSDPDEDPDEDPTTSDEELEAPMEDQPLPADASPTALSPGYIADFDPEEDEEDPEEDPADHPVDGGDNDDNESSDDDDDDDDVVKDEEDEEEEEHLAPADPSAILIYDLACITEFAAALPSSLPPPPENIKSLKDNIRETMTTVNQGMSVEEIERVVAQRVANAIEAIAIYKTKTNMARKSMSQTERQEDKVAENASNKRKWEGHGEKKHYGGSKPLCSKCNYHHDGLCAPKCHKCNRVGHLAHDFRSYTNAMNVGIKGTIGMIARSEITKTMKTKLEVLENVEWCMPLEEEKPNKTLTTLRMRSTLKRENYLA